MAASEGKLPLQVKEEEEEPEKYEIVKPSETYQVRQDRAHSIF